jgi:predicted transposase YdaD
MIMSINKQYKDSVFSLLFSEPDALRELYGALAGVEVDPSVPVTINTLERALFMERINDLSFEIGGKVVVLIEHQSTINPNMALRMLLYIGRVYEKLIDNKSLYGAKKARVPRPEFIMLYNGVADYPDESALRLSDLFERSEGLGLIDPESPALELAVKVYNINEGRNEGVVRRCELLREYSVFVAKARECERKGEGREEAMRETVKWCVEHDILKKFLEANASEVMNMLLNEWNWDEAREAWHEAGLEEGMAQGMAQGIEEGMTKGIAQGMAQGMAKRDAELLAMLEAGGSVEDLKARLAAECGAGLQA